MLEHKIEGLPGGALKDRFSGKRKKARLRQEPEKARCEFPAFRNLEIAGMPGGRGSSLWDMRARVSDKRGDVREGQ